MNYTDEKGITWFMSEGKKELISQSRDEPSDDRWKCLRCGANNVSNICREGFRCKNCNANWTNREMLDECNAITSQTNRSLQFKKELEELIRKEKEKK